ncbi:bifunctional DNA-formamidopyrimidine glycosylase/DNA-(apurinic or apyrimidinic site) lyase [Corynebacterium heidelbergense]|uniref:Formamidopyrimidine-DNA glycosylase n=1 Tax=Corynebacterium heidelbergense TaxID=2055947 RepID=A0A364VAZ3_9CORY|nr:bifunctional DNA-formamidopyrimidine glycosylase/DNA-(apurinic or apyrimidinic site) lyase [Corynebacterium heidelbergense]RAV33807.1 DNA-formamidopyrimidine glycosylase [Corynebacterium heidelbergense]WCZ36789.1 Formamidopyrimidine-DNA glycosylase 1 [Corynebacterium heidelbergense]
MPELPEVETVRRGLHDHLIGARFEAVNVRHPRAARSHTTPEDLGELLVGRRIIGAQRRGKYLWLPLDGDRPQALFVHLGMSGQMLIQAPPGHPHLRIRADLALPNGDRRELSFVDQRTFGQWNVVDLCPDPHGLQASVPTIATHIAPDPLEEGFDARAVAGVIKNKRTEIKRVLLDQTVISGIGNIYADEALFAAGVRPRRMARWLTLRTITATIESAAAVMTKALEVGGTSFDSLYVNVNGSSGYFSRSLNVYGRGGQPCNVCGQPIVRQQWMNRSSHYCPQCQH